MKKKLLIMSLLSIITIIFTTGCLDNDNLEGSNITTTVYPVEYLITRLYGEHSNISSIYPNGTDITEYKLTNKKLNDYSENTTLFIYNGLGDEKEIAKKFVDKLAGYHHYSVFEHGTVYLQMQSHGDIELMNKICWYRNNPYSKVNSDEDGVVYITTNYRVLIENNKLEDLK